MAQGREPEPRWRRLTLEPARPDRVRESPAAPWLAVGTVCIGAFMGQLDASIVTVALPTIGRDLGAGVGSVEWVVLAYVIVLAGAVAAVGRLADAAGHKLLYTYGFAVFAAASAACAASPSLGVLVACRVVQGGGAVMLQANSVALIRQVAPRGRLGAAIGAQGTAQAVGLAAGPSVGGALIALGGWRLIFLVNVPVGLVGIALAWLLLPRSRHRTPDRRFDIGGTVLLAATAACLLGSLSAAVQPHAALATTLLGSGGAGLAVATAVYQRRRPGAVVDRALSRNRPFVLGSLSALFAYAALFGILFAMPYYLESAAGLDPRAAGLRLTALPVALALVAPFGGRLADRMGSRGPGVTGLAAAAAGVGLLAEAPAGASGLAALAVIGAGLGVFIPANNAAVMGSAPVDRAGAAGGLLNMTRSLGTALGVAIGGLAFALAARQPAGAPVSGAAAAAGLHAAGVVLAAAALVASAVAWLGTGTSAPGAGRRAGPDPRSPAT